MLKTALNMLVGAFICAAVGAASALVGTAPPPGSGPALVDGVWLNGLAGGLNNLYQSGITAAGTTQATATQLPSGILLVEVDTAAASTGVNLPPCIPGTEVNLYNNGANPLAVFPAVANNPITAAQDTINNAVSFAGPASHVSAFFFCAKAGVWAAK
jgi:hypothetical protein